MKSEILYAYTIGYRELPNDLRFSLAHIAEEELYIPHLSFREAFKTSSLEKACLGKEARERMMTKLAELDNKKMHDSSKRLAAFARGYAGIKGSHTRNIYSTNNNTKLIIIDDQDQETAVTDVIVSLITEISPEEKKLIEADISKLEKIQNRPFRPLL